MPVSVDDITKATEMLKDFGATRVLVFGSAAEHPETARDLDLACDGIRGWRFFEVLGRIKEELAVPVDLVELSPGSGLTRFILRTGKVLYESK